MSTPKSRRTKHKASPQLQKLWGHVHLSSHGSMPMIVGKVSADRE